jgi:hypothetical protein
VSDDKRVTTADRNRPPPLDERAKHRLAEALAVEGVASAVLFGSLERLDDLRSFAAAALAAASG